MKAICEAFDEELDEGTIGMVVECSFECADVDWGGRMGGESQLDGVVGTGGTRMGSSAIRADVEVTAL